MFNLKKKAQIKPTEKMLSEWNDSYDYSTYDSSTPVISDKQLESSRNESDEGKIAEKQLEEVRNASSKVVITEKQLNNGIDSSWMKTRNDKGQHPMDMHKENSNKLADEFKKENKTDTKDNKEFWDFYLNVGSHEITNNVQSSQLLSNYETREDFNKNNKSIQKEASIKDADAMIYHIYRTAYYNGRSSLTEEETQIINDINASKIKLLASIDGPYEKEDMWDGNPIEEDKKKEIDPNAVDVEFRNDTTDMLGDEIEEEIRSKLNLKDMSNPDKLDINFSDEI